MPTSPSRSIVLTERRSGQPTSAKRARRAGVASPDPRYATVDGDLVFAVGQYGEVACLDAATGKEHWRKSLVDDFGGTVPHWGYAGMPLVDGDNVILMPGGRRGDLVALRKATGELVWQSKDLTDGIHYSSPIVEVIGGVRQYIQLTDASVAGIAAADGRLLWRAPRKGKTAVIPTPIYHDGCVYVTSGYGIGCNLFKISVDGDKFSATEVYANKVLTNHHGGAILVGEYLYGFSEGKGWTCQDFATGKAMWQDKKLGKGSLVYADGMLYLRAESGKGTMALIEATPEGYREKGASTSRIAASRTVGRTRSLSADAFIFGTKTCCCATTCRRNERPPLPWEACRAE